MFIITITIGFLFDFIGGVCVSHLWNWFVSPTTHLPTITWVVGMGIMFMYDITHSFSGALDTLRNDYDSDDIFRAWLLAAFAWLVTMVVAFVIHLCV